VAAAVALLELLEQAVQEAVAMARQEPMVQTVLQIPAVVAVVLVGQVEQAAQAALALSSLKYLTTYPQHSLVALHLACPHPVGLTSTL
jgi:hypothetical protein